MKNFLKKGLEFLQDHSGNNSSKSLGFLLSLAIVYYEFHELIDELTKAKAFDEAVTLFMYGGIGMLIMGGFITAEFIKKNVK